MEDDSDDARRGEAGPRRRAPRRGAAATTTAADQKPAKKLLLRSRSTCRSTHRARAGRRRRLRGHSLECARRPPARLRGEARRLTTTNHPPKPKDSSETTRPRLRRHGGPPSGHEGNDRHGDFDMGRNLGMSTYFTTFLKALLVACLVAGLFSLKIMRRYRRGHFGTRTPRCGAAPVVGLVPRLCECGGDAGLRRRRTGTGGGTTGDAHLSATFAESATSTTGTSLCGTSSATTIASF